MLFTRAAGCALLRGAPRAPALLRGAPRAAFSAAPPFAMQRAPYNSLRLDARALTAEAIAGAPAWLTSQLPAWRAAGVSSVWVEARLPAHAALLGALAAAPLSFSFHHARGADATLLRWLPDGASRVPAFGGTQVGVGGVAVDGAGRVLLVKEKSAAARGGDWKFPGGLADIGEDLGAAAIREVWEETGVRCEFRGLLALRHAHGVAWGMSDLYALALLRPLAGAGGAGGDPLPLALDPTEIAEAAWHDAAAFAASTPHPLNAEIARLAARAARADADRALIAGRDVYFAVTQRWATVFAAEPLGYAAAAGAPPPPPRAVPPPPWVKITN